MITLVSGTNRPHSMTKKVLDIYNKMLLKKGLTTQVIDLVDMPKDFIQSALYEQSGKNAQFNTMRNKMLKAEKYIFFIPEYNGSFPGVFKTFIDGLAYPHTFKGKKCALVGISSGIQGGILAMSHLTDIFNYAKMQVLAEKPKLLNIDQHLQNDEITNPLYMTLLEEQIESFLHF